MANYGVQGFLNEGRSRPLDEYMEYMQATPESFDLNSLALDTCYYAAEASYGGYLNTLSSFLPSFAVHSSDPTSASDAAYGGGFGGIPTQDTPTIEIGQADSLNIEADLLDLLNSQIYSDGSNLTPDPNVDSEAIYKMLSLSGEVTDKSASYGDEGARLPDQSSNKPLMMSDSDMGMSSIDPALGEHQNKLYNSLTFQIKTEPGFLQVPLDTGYNGSASLKQMNQDMALQLQAEESHAQIATAQPSNRFAILVATDNVAQQLQQSLMVPKVGDEFSMMECRYLDGGSQKMQRVYRPPTARRNLSTSSSRASERAGGVIWPTIQTDKQLLQACIAQVCLAVSPQNGSEHRSPIDTAVYMGNLSTKRSGIPSQLAPPSTTVRPELTLYLDRWTSSRPRSDLAFRLTDDSGESFNLEELQVAVAILTSRPPRRINYYPAPQLTSEEQSKGNLEGSLLVTWDQHPHGMRACSDEMRRSYNCLPGPKAEVEDTQAEGVDPSPASTGIIYKPRFVQGKGGSKMGWCDNCPEGGFFRMKNSGYLYHKNHEHGIFANGHVFEDPLCIRRKIERDTKWEGLCGICYRWMDIDNNEPEKWGTWFRHYNNCTKEYDELKKAILRTGAPVQFVEIEYQPYMTD